MRPSRCLALLALLPTLVWAKTWKVDDDRQQCRHADFTRIQDAVDAASPGDRIQVCPGLYLESVTVDKPLTLKGSGPGLATLRTGNPNVEAVVRPPAGSDGFTVAAASTRVTFFTVWGQQAGVLEDAGIRTTSGSSNSAIERNAIWDFQTGVELRSNNQEGDRVVGNDLRGPAGVEFNGVYGVHLIAIREATLVADNVLQHFRTAIIAHPENLSLTPVRRIKILHNRISDTWDAIELITAEDSEIVGNGASVDRSGIEVLECARMSVRLNSIVGTGVEDFGQGPGIHLSETDDFLVFGNEVSHFKTSGIFDSGAIDFSYSTHGTIEGNLVHDTVVGHGIALNFSSNGNRVKGNITHHNQRDGLLVEVSSTGNKMVNNVSFLNGQFDAQDGNRTSNLWCRTWCLTDAPPGTICMQTDPGCH